MTRARVIPDPESYRIFIRQSDGKKRLVYTGRLLNDTTDRLGVKTGDFANSVPVPQNLYALGKSDSVSVRWDKVTHGGLLGYKLYRDGTLIQTLTGNSYEDENVNSGVTYTYYVTAYDIYGDESPQSDSDSATVGEDYAAPTNLQGTGSDSQADLTWDAPAGSSTPDSYEVSQNGSIVATISHPTTSATITGLTNGTDYNFAVRAVYGSVNSNYTSQITVTPFLGSNQWFAVCGEDSYNVRILDYDMNILGTGQLNTRSDVGAESMSLNKDGYIAFNSPWPRRHVFHFDDSTDTLTSIYDNGVDFPRSSQMHFLADGKFVEGVRGNSDPVVQIWESASANQIATVDMGQNNPPFDDSNSLHSLAAAAKTGDIYLYWENNTNYYIGRFDTNLSLQWYQSAPGGYSGGDQRNVALGCTPEGDVIYGVGNTLHKYDRNQNNIWSFNLTDFNTLSDISIEADGSFYVVDRGQDKVRKYTAGDASTDPSQVWETALANAHCCATDGVDHLVVGSSGGQAAILKTADGSVREAMQSVGVSGVVVRIGVHPGPRSIL